MLLWAKIRWSIQLSAAWDFRGGGTLVHPIFDAYSSGMSWQQMESFLMRTTVLGACHQCWLSCFVGLSESPCCLPISHGRPKATTMVEVKKATHKWRPTPTQSTTINIPRDRGFLHIFSSNTSFTHCLLWLPTARPHPKHHDVWKWWSATSFLPHPNQRLLQKLFRYVPMPFPFFISKTGPYWFSFSWFMSLRAKLPCCWFPHVLETTWGMSTQT